MPSNKELYIDPGQMLQVFQNILVHHGFDDTDAMTCANIFRDNSLDGVYTHGVNRFPRFIEYIQKGYVIPGNKPQLKKEAGSIEQWDGHLGPGPLNALFATEQAIRLAKANGMGCVGLRNTNHWMRGGYYGWQAALSGYIFIGFTNTIANMPAWGGKDRKLGNNPLVIAVPYGGQAIVLDMAMSQYAIGALHQSALRGEALPVDGGFDVSGKISRDPSAILDSGRPMPAGYWKGSGLALLLDILAVVLSGGLSTASISKQEAEYGVSQVFIAIDEKQLGEQHMINEAVYQIIKDYQLSVPIEPGSVVSYPGERVIRARKKNLQQGIPVLPEIWNEILLLNQ